MRRMQKRPQQMRAVKDDIPLANYALGVFNSEKDWMDYLTKHAQPAINNTITVLNTLAKHAENAQQRLEQYLDKPATAEQRAAAEKPHDYHFFVGKDTIDHYKAEIAKLEQVIKLLRNL